MGLTLLPSQCLTLNPLNNMAVSVEVKKQVLHFTDDKKEIYVASADRGDVIDTDKIAQFVAQDTGARPAQVKMILSSLIDSMMSWIEEGHGVRLGNFGSFLPSVKSDSSENPDEVGVKRMRLSFRPTKELTTRLGRVSISIENAYKSGSSTDNEAGTGGEGDDNTTME